MEADELPTSPRKKHKAYHGCHLNMEDPAAKSSHAMQDHQSINASGNEDRLDKEAQCGITEYVSPQLPGFRGVLKKRYTDFLVNEILPNGKVIHLENLKRTSDQQRLSQAASKVPQQQNENAGQATPKLERPNTPKENTPPRFESTNLNKVKQGSRKRETVYMRHGAESLSLLGEQPNHEVDSSKQSSTVEDYEGTAHDEVAQPAEIDSGGTEEMAPVAKEGSGCGASDQPKAPTNGAPDVAEIPDPTNSGDPSTAGDWQAYAQSNKDGAAFALSDEDKDLLISFFDSETVDSILALLHRILASPLRKAKDFGSVTTNPIERSVRTEIHQAIRRIFSSRLETMTDDAGAMVVFAANPSSSRGAKRNEWRNDRKPQQPKGKLGWAQLGGDYLHFTIYKENRDTMEAIAHLARILKLRPQLFQFAGTKDRRGITVQRASVFRVQSNRLFDAGKTLKQSKIGDYEYHPQGLQLGDLLGNEFVITLRDCDFQLDGDLESETKIERASSVFSTVVENFCSHGFINYFGLQRFGSFSASTHAIGRSMLQGDFKSACEAILSFQPSALAAATQHESGQHDSSISRDDIARASALHSFATTGHSKEALEQLPRKFSAEACLIRHLSRADHRNDYLGALQTISRNLRLMYVHAYQSLVWNIAATARWKAHSEKVLPGDLVLVNEHPDPSIKQKTDTSPVDQDGEPIFTAEASDRAYTSDEIFTRARALTESELASPDCKISIFDIVLPLPGYDILYPANPSADIYKKFMASEEGGKLDPYDMRRKWKDVSLSGSYRKLLAKSLGTVEWEIRAYGAKGEDEQFVETDLERLEKTGAVRGNEGGRGQQAGRKPLPLSSKDVCPGQEVATSKQPDTNPMDIQMDNTPTEPSAITATQDSDIPMTEQTTADDTNTAPQSTEQKNDKLAVILKMQLGSSTYATMALRELMKEGGVRTWKMEHSGGR
ncbi:MAG: hypothetical protein Q9188_001970 [Gyalolechia gomerana]